MLDGNHLAHTQRRLKPLRDVAAGPLPGQTPVVLDPALGPAIDVAGCQAGHAQERSPLDPILEAVAEKGVWGADRNFCATALLFGVAGRRGFFAIRRHAATLSWERGSEWVAAGRTATGTLAEQTIWPTEPGGAELAARRVRLTLDHPTRDGDGVIGILTDLPTEVAASAVAGRYRGRRSVGGLFLRLTTVLNVFNSLVRPLYSNFTIPMSGAYHRDSISFLPSFTVTSPSTRMARNFPAGTVTSSSPRSVNVPFR